MSELSRVLIFLGLLLVGIGVLIGLVSKVPGMGKMPGDIYIQKENFSFYFPVVTCLLLSVVLTLIFNLLGRK